MYWKPLVPLLLLGFLISPAVAQAPIDNIPTEDGLLIMAGNTLIAKNYVPLKDQHWGSLIYDIVFCESSWDNTKTGKEGEIGLCQFKEKTFKWMNGLAMERGDITRILDINSPEDQLELLKWGISNGYGSHWTCWRKLQ